jgi:aspartate/methionine/tyrosine aminotransferase
MDAVRGVQTFMTYCAPHPMQWSAVHALEEGQGWMAEARHAYSDAAASAASTVGVAKPAGGTFLFFDASRFFGPGESIMGFLERCADQGVILTPGAASGEHYGAFVRLCFTAVDPATLARALSTLARVLHPN